VTQAKPMVSTLKHQITANEVKRLRKEKVTWSISEIDQEIKWRIWFPQIQVDWTTDLSDEQTQILFDGFIAFCEENLHVKFPGKGRMPFTLRDAQRDVIWAWIKYRRNINLKARQIGFSTLVAAFCLWAAFGWPDREIVMLSKTERESVKLLGKTRYAMRSMPEWVRLRGPKLLDKTSQRMTFDNDSVITSLPSNNDPARGDSLFLIILDEWAFLPNPEAAYASVEATIDLGGRAIGLSTANGEGNFFHDMWLEAQAGVNGFNPIFFPWSAVPERTAEWYESKKRELAARIWQLHQEYPTTPEEAFIGSGNPVFNLDIIRKFQSETATEWTIQGTSRKDVTLYEGGPFMVWEPPDNDSRYSYVIGNDTAMGLEHGDATVAWVICVNTGEPVAVWHGRVDPDVFGEQILPAIGWWYRNAIIVPEVNNHGLTVVKALVRAKYKNIYKRRAFARRQDKALESLGYMTTHTTKPVLIDELAAWMRDVGNIPHKLTLHELMTYTRDGNGKMSGSPHDDCVMALALAVAGIRYARTERPAAETSADRVKGSFAWYEKILDKQNKPAGGIRPQS
jgi:hypothetical protein